MSNEKYIQSVVKACELLTIISNSENGIKLMQAAEIMEQKLPCVYHLSKTLISCGFIKKKQDNTLVLGDKFIKAAERGKDKNLNESTSVELTRLYNLFPQAIFIFAEINIPTVNFALRISSERPYVIQKEKEQVFNIYVNAVGIISLAMANKENRRLMMYHQSFSEYGVHLWKTEDSLLEYLDKAKAEGFACSPFEQQSSFKIAVPVMDQSGELKGAIGAKVPVAIIKGKKDEELIKSELFKSALLIKNKL